MRLSSFIQLIRNENMKIYRRFATWTMIGLLILGILGIGIIQKFAMDAPDNSNWKQNLTEQNESYKQMFSDAPPGIPDAQKRYFEQQMKVNEYRIEHNQPPVDSNSLWGFMDTTSNLSSLVTLFTIIIAAGSVASEFTWGTIKLLLIRPVGRSKILLSKYIASFLFALLLLITLFVISFLAGGIFFGFSQVSTPYLAFINGSVVESSMPLHMIGVYGLNSVNLIMMVTFAFMISTVFRSNSLAIGLAIFLMFTGVQVVQIFSEYSWAKYILFANTDLTQYIKGTPMVEGMTMTFSIITLLVYFVVFNALSWYIFNKRDVAA
ncbi:ABC transporter permease [Tepidibacillus marianensis]|uniref:ABC transporter permease n=1 Tax=Tepidibacillus marianensis TaxID=3131995 RepID=UPI0030CD532B